MNTLDGNRRVWLVAAGRKGDNRLHHWLAGGYCAIGFRCITKEVPAGSTQEQIRDYFLEARPDQSKSWSNWTQSMYNFLTRMEPGDAVVVRAGTTLHFGRITGAPQYIVDPDPGDDYRRRRTIDWIGHCILPETARTRIVPRTTVQLVNAYRPRLLELMKTMVQ